MLDRTLNALTGFSIQRPRLVISLTIAFTLAFGSFLPRMAVDTDPKHMLPATSPVRQHNDRVEQEFALHADVIVLGVVNEGGIFNRDTLRVVSRLTAEIQGLAGVVSRDVTSLTTVDDVTADGGGLAVRPLLREVPETEAELSALRRAVAGNPLLIGRVVSRDATVTAISVPLEPSANGKKIADEIRRLLPKEPSGDRYLLAGDPVARDTFGAEMFRQMALFSPAAGLVMCIALWLMFRSLPLVAANMGVAVVGIVWSMGLLVGLGFPVHIMSSMSPVFLMAIATDSVHIFNELAFQLRETGGKTDEGQKRRAVLDAMAAIGKPVFYSDVTTAAGFAALATASIVPVRIFGLVVAFGTLVILLMSFTLVPAILALLPGERIGRIARQAREVPEQEPSRLVRLGEFCQGRARAIAAGGALALAVAAVGLFRIHVNNNMVHWFKPGSSVRGADRVLNERLGGTATGYLVVQGRAPDAMKDPSLLRAIEGLQRELERDPLVGKTSSVVDVVKRVNLALHRDDPAFDRVPDSAEEVAQDLFLLGTSAKPSDLDNLVDYPFQQANVVLQIKSWDAGAMRGVIRRTAEHLARHPLPGGASVQPAGIAHFNMVWSDEVLWGMLESFLAGLALVLALLVAQTRSLRWGAVAFLPLLFTIAVIYGVVGLVGKDFDMPVAVLSTLSLGMAVDFAIHFVGRFQQRHRERGDLSEALVFTVARPGRGIFLNALLFASGFAVMVFAELTPYVTVGVLMAAVMLLSALASVVFLPGLISLFRGALLEGGAR